jgi:Anti-sigma-K factor rskA
VVHVNSVLLAGHALGQDDALDAADQEHLASCSHCRAELDQYRRVVTLGQGAQASEVPTPPLDRIWRSIQAELAPNSITEGIAAPKTVVAESVPPLTANDKPASDVPVNDVPVNDVPASGVPANDVPANGETNAGNVKPIAARRRKWWPIAAAAAALGLVVGAGATVIIDRNDVQVAASTALSALPGQTGHGTAELLRTPNDPELRVSVDGPQPADRYREVWLINSDGQRMYSLGVLPESGTGTYPLPTLLADGLDGFTIVDVSIEPYDGNPEHSRNSQVRGSLPE